MTSCYDGRIEIDVSEGFIEAGGGGGVGSDAGQGEGHDNPGPANTHVD